MSRIPTNGAVSLALINRKIPAVALLDIKMPGISALEVARRMTHQPLVVFVTAFHNYAVESFEQEAVDYVLKPPMPERIDRAVYEIRYNLLWCVRTHPSHRVRTASLRKQDLVAASERARVELEDVTQRHASDRPPDHAATIRNTPSEPEST